MNQQNDWQQKINTRYNIPFGQTSVQRMDVGSVFSQFTSVALAKKPIINSQFPVDVYACWIC